MKWFRSGTIAAHRIFVVLFFVTRLSRGRMNCRECFYLRTHECRLIGLLDDIAAIAKVTAASLDDVASQAVRAGVKAARVGSSSTTPPSRPLSDQIRAEPPVLSVQMRHLTDMSTALLVDPILDANALNFLGGFIRLCPLLHRHGLAGRVWCNLSRRRS
jgi:hypothetical protein